MIGLINLITGLLDSIFNFKSVRMINLSSIIRIYRKFLSHILRDFTKAHSTQLAFFKLLQSCQKELDNGGFVETILLDLPKAYDCIPHELLRAK